MASVSPPRSHLSERRRQQLFEVIDQLEVLPTSATVPMKVLRLKQSGTAGAAEIGAALSADAALSAKLLGLVNSAAFAPANRVTRVSTAVTMVGVKNLMPLVFGLSLSGLFHKLALRPEERDALFHASLLKGCAARAAARLTAPDQQEEAFLCGLLQDLGVPVILAADRAVLAEAGTTFDLQDAAARSTREHQMYGTDHAAAGRRIVERLGLPELFAAAVGAHHAGADALAAAVGPGLARALDLAAALPHRVSACGKAVQSIGLKVKMVAGADAGAAERLAGEILDGYAATGCRIGDADDAAGAFRQFLQDITAEVARSTQEAVVASQSTIAGLRTREAGLVREMDQLKEQVIKSETDSLTNVLNRAAFLRRLPLLLQAARAQGAECHVGYADVDNFKKVNDTHGHAVGDDALREVAARLTAVVKGRGLVARMGGDEFACVLVRRPADGPPPDYAAALSEHLGRIVVTTPGGPLQIGASAGLFAFGVPRAEDTAERILARADQLMYEVKRSGKGRCIAAAA